MPSLPPHGQLNEMLPLLHIVDPRRSQQPRDVPLAYTPIQTHLHSELLRYVTPRQDANPRYT
jgi:hypothetical protein